MTRRGSNVSGKTGQKCDLNGYYRSSCHWGENEIPMTRGNPFPPCVQRKPGEPGPEGAKTAQGAPGIGLAVFRCVGFPAEGG